MRAMKGNRAAALARAHAPPARLDPVDVDAAAPDDDREKHALAGERMQLLERGAAEGTDVEGLVVAGKREHAVAQLIARAAGIARHVALQRERRECAMDHVLVGAELMREFGHAKAALGTGERGEHRQYPLCGLIAVARRRRRLR